MARLDDREELHRAEEAEEEGALVAMPPTPSEDARAVLRQLKQHGNVLIVGAPATGKTRLLLEVREAFQWTPGATYDPKAAVPLPAIPEDVALWLPSPDRGSRKVFETVFHQNTKFGEILRAREARVSFDGSSGTTFRVSEGILYRASEYALDEDGTALLIIDEVNRGPAVSVLGPAMAALEYDKRLGDDGAQLATTAFYELMNDEGDYSPYAFPKHLYVLAAMNQADTSIEALDVAFMRRWEPYRLDPESEVLAAHLGVASSSDELPDAPATHEDVYRAAMRAWEAVNRRIRLGRGPEFEIGHGVLMQGEPPETIVEALAYVRIGWRRIRQHLDEVFFGSVDGLAASLNVDGTADHPIKRETALFANDSVSFLNEPSSQDDEALYKTLRAVAG
jgi:5-methylcytosine-specific restriction enzyme B